MTAELTILDAPPSQIQAELDQLKAALWIASYPEKSWTTIC
jgi:hypothetical protein